MDVKITEVKPAATAEWDTIWHNCEYATYFHSREWAEIWNLYTHKKLSIIVPSAKLIRFSDNKSALIAQSERRILNRFMSRTLSTPAGCYGGWLSSDNLDYEHALELFRYLREQNMSLSLRINPFDPLSSLVTSEFHNADTTHVIELKGGYGEAERRAKPSHRRAVKKARQHGVVVQEATTDDEWHEYYLAYRETLQRWRQEPTAVYAEEFFEILREQNSPYIKLWVAKYNGEVVSGIICLYSRWNVAYWHGATREGALHLRPTNLLFDEVIRELSKMSYQWLDLGASGGSAGVMRFKESLGAVVRPCPIIDFEPLSYKLLRSAFARCVNS